jgi:hypothetical protein
VSPYRCSAAVALVLVCHAGSALADGAVEAARHLFDQGRDLMAAGKYPEACAKLEDSEGLDPGIGTEFNLARCYDLAGRLASARTMYMRVIAETHAAGESEREGVAKDLETALEPRVPHLRIAVPSPQQSIEIRLDGLLIPPADWSTALPVDGGSHEVTATAPLSLPWKTVVLVAQEGETRDVSVPPLVAKAAMTATPAPVAAPRPADTSPGRAQKISAIAIGALGLVSAGFGTYFGAHAASLASQANPLCTSSGCDPTGYGLRGDSRSSGDASTVSFVGAGVLLAAAGVLWLTAPSR